MPIAKKSTDQMIKETREIVQKAAEDAAHDFLYTARKKDKNLSTDQLLALLTDKTVVNTLDVIRWFTEELRREVE